MKFLFRHRWIGSAFITAGAVFASLLLTGALDVAVIPVVFLLAALIFSYPSLLERLWQAKTLPTDTIHVPVERIRNGEDYDLLKLFEVPQVYQLIKNRYSRRTGDPHCAGLFLYCYLPSPLYETRNSGPETIYRHLAARLKADLQDPQDFDLIAQRNLPLLLGFRFLPKNAFPYHEFAKVINVVKKDYYRENTTIRGVLQSKKRVFRLHIPEDNEWRTFQPYQEETGLLYGGSSLVHDFRYHSQKSLTPNQVSVIDAERVEYPERVAFGSLLTYAKKGEISLQGQPDVIDKLYIDRVNVLVQGPERRKEILAQLSQILNRELAEEDFYPLFNYGLKLRGYLETGKSLPDFISSQGNFALYYDNEKGWTVIRLAPGLELRLQEAYWSSEPKPIQVSSSLTTSRAVIISGSADALLRFEISTGTPTRGQIFAADEMIENKVRSFAQIFGYRLLRSVGSGAEGCLYLAERNGSRFYLKSPDGQLATEEIQIIEKLKQADLVPSQIKTYPEDRMVVLPEYQPLPSDGGSIYATASSLLFAYIKRVWETGYICLDLTPDHVRLAVDQKKIFLIDFSGYAELSHFRKQPMELLADRKKIEYRTPEEFVKDFRDAEKFQVFLMGLLLYQLARGDRGLPYALKVLEKGAQEYEKCLEEDLKQLGDCSAPLREMLGYDPSQRKNFAQLQSLIPQQPILLDAFWKRAQS